MDNKRKYPLKLFIIGIIINMIKKFYIGILLLTFLIIGIFNDRFIKVSGIIFCLWVIFAVAEQIILRKVALEKSSNEQYNQLMDSLLGKNGLFSKSENKIDINTTFENSIKNNINQDDDEQN